MKCKKFEFTASAYLDRQLDDRQSADYRQHLAVCPDCRTQLAQTEEASLMLRGSHSPEVPREFRSYVMTAVVLRATGEISAAGRAREWLLRLNPVPVSYATGLAVSFMMFALLLSGIKPIPVMQAATGGSQMFIFPAVVGSDSEYHNYNDIPADQNSAGNLHYYQLPRVLDNSALVSFSNIAYQKPGNDGMSALIEVDAEGRAKLVDVLAEPSDSNMVEQLWWSLSERNFQPAIVEGKPVTTRIVLLVEKVDVGG
jgi:putative zinc finger protein